MDAAIGTWRRTACAALAVALGTAGCAWVSRASVPAPPPAAQANAASYAPAVSGDGKLVAFRSDASNLVPGDTNAVADVFVKDLANGAVTRVSVGAAGVQANAASATLGRVAISDDGRYVAFESAATNLVAGDTNGTIDVFVRDRTAGTTERVSVATGGTQANGLSSDPSMSADGQIVAFTSSATNLASGDTNGVADVIVRNRTAGTTAAVSVTAGGATADGPSAAAAVSGDGSTVAFSSDASNIVGGDTNALGDVFARTLAVSSTERVSVSTGGVQATAPSFDPAVNDNGNLVAFSTQASNLVLNDTNAANDVLLRNRSIAVTERISVSTTYIQGNGDSNRPTISGDGRFVAFESIASTLVTGDTNANWDVIVRDRGSLVTARASTTQLLGQANGASRSPAISTNGRGVALLSGATNLDAQLADTNGVNDVYERATISPTVTSITPNTAARGGAAAGFTISGTGFLPGAEINSGNFPVTWTITSITPTTITGTRSVPSSSPTGGADINVMNPGTGAGPLTGALGRCAACLTVS